MPWMEMSVSGAILMTLRFLAGIYSQLTSKFSHPIAWRHIFEPSEPMQGYYKSGNGRLSQCLISCLNSPLNLGFWFSPCDTLWNRRFRASCI